MKIEKIVRDTHRITFPQGELEVNLLPANAQAPSTPCTPQWDGKLIYTHDAIGICALTFKDCPPVPRICWDNREHQFWQGYSGAFEPRNTIVNDIKINQAAYERAVNLSFYYISNFVKVTESWYFREPADDSFITWDTVYQFENLNPFALKSYMSFFACYHQPGKNYSWDANGDLTECADDFAASADEERQRRYHAVTDSFREIVQGWGIKNPTFAEVLYRQPVLLSDKRDCYKNGQHVLFVQPEVCVNIVSAMNQARDYTLAPARKDLEPQGSFTARIRHIVANFQGIEDIKPRWELFLRDCAGDQSEK